MFCVMHDTILEFLPNDQK